LRSSGGALGHARIKAAKEAALTEQALDVDEIEPARPDSSIRSLRHRADIVSSMALTMPLWSLWSLLPRSLPTSRSPRSNLSFINYLGIVEEKTNNATWMQSRSRKTGRLGEPRLIYTVVAG
jgi:hypothetical protein